MSELGVLTPFIFVGLAAFGLASFLWALRVSEGARGAAKKYRERANSLEEKLARADSVFGAHPGVILVWEHDEEVLLNEWGTPKIYGSPMAMAALLRYTDDSMADDPANRILEALVDLESRDMAGQDTTLRQRLFELRGDGAPFTLTMVGPSGRILEADGRTAGARAVLWLSDTTVKGVEESNARGRLEETRRVIARDPNAFLEMLGAAPFPAWRMSSAGKLVWCNNTYLTALDETRLDTALEKQAFLDASLAEFAESALKTGMPRQEIRTINVKGERRSMQLLVFPISGGVGGMAIDVTQEEEARKSLDRHRKAHDETLNHVADGVAIFSHDKQLIFHNRAFRDIWNISEAELSGGITHGGWLDAMRERRMLPHKQNYAAWRAEELGHYQDASPLAEVLWNLPDKRALKITRQRHPMGGLLMLFKDITDELTLTAKYNGLIKVQRATLDNLHEAVAVFGGDGILQLKNRAFVKLWTLSPDLSETQIDFDTLTSHGQSLFPDKGVWDAIKARVTNPSPSARQEFRGEMKRSDGSVLTFLTQPLPDGNTLLAFADVSASRRIEAALNERAEAFREADRLKTEFVKHMSYQLRNPLTTILGYSELLQSGKAGPLSPDQLEHIMNIASSGRNLTKLIDNVVDFAVIEAGQMELEIDVFPIERAISSAIELISRSATDTEVDIQMEVTDDVRQVQADEKRITQVIFNLLSNALRFSNAGDSIRIKAEAKAGMLQLSVTDSGDGIAYERQAESFDTFKSGDQKGAGLGLSLVRSFIELHKGWVAMRSKPGEGTSVLCVLPLKQTANDGLLQEDPKAA